MLSKITSAILDANKIWNNNPSVYINTTYNDFEKQCYRVIKDSYFTRDKIKVVYLKLNRD